MSTLRCDNFGPSAGGTTYSARGIAKAWVNFDGTGTIAARDSENVSSLTDNGTGNYTVNLSNAFGSFDYGVSGSTFESNDNATVIVLGIHSDVSTSSAVRCLTNSTSSGNFDGNFVSITTHGDLA